METVNLEKICELLEKGVDNPSIQNEEGKFSLAKWKEEVQTYTEPFLRAITKILNEAVMQDTDLWKTTKFKIGKKYQAKQRRISSLQQAKWKLPEPFVIEARDNDLRPVEGFVSIGPIADSAGGPYVSSICWGLRWWGTGEKANAVHQIFMSLNHEEKFTASFFDDGNFGKSTWLSNSISNRELARSSVESIAEIIKNDFIKLSSILSENMNLFPPPPIRGPNRQENKEQDYSPIREDVEKAILYIWSQTRKTQIDKALVMKTMESEFSRRGIALKTDWWNLIEGKLEDWFG